MRVVKCFPPGVQLIAGASRIGYVLWIDVIPERAGTCRVVKLDRLGQSFLEDSLEGAAFLSKERPCLRETLVGVSVESASKGI